MSSTLAYFTVNVVVRKWHFYSVRNNTENFWQLSENNNNRANGNSQRNVRKSRPFVITSEKREKSRASELRKAETERITYSFRASLIPSRTYDDGWESLGKGEAEIIA